LKIAILAGCAAVALALAAPARNLAITNTRIIDGTGTGIDHGRLVDKDGRIVSLSGRDAAAWRRGHAAENMRSYIIDGEPLQDKFNLTHAVLLVKDGKVISDYRGRPH
jgi:hypothetical protein